MATNGRAFALKDPNNNGLGAPKYDWQKPYKGQCTRETGFLAYYEICKLGLNVVTAIGSRLHTATRAASG